MATKVVKRPKMLIEESDVKRMMTNLAKILEDKASMEMHNECGTGDWSKDKKYEQKLSDFDSKVFIKEELEKLYKRKYAKASKTK